MTSTFDAVVVGAGPNGLAAAIELSRSGLGVLLMEANQTIGGSARTEELTLPGFRHDVGSAVYPLGIGSPYLDSLPLREHGMDWVHPPVPLAHPLDGGRAVILRRGIEATAAGLGRDSGAYRRLVSPFVRRWSSFADHVLDAPTKFPRNPLLMMQFGVRAIRPATKQARAFHTPEARALFAGNAAHSGVPLDDSLSGAVGVTLMIAAHAVGWPMPRGGAGRLTESMASYFQSLGGTIETGRCVGSLEELPSARAIFLALTHRQVAQVAGPRLPGAYRSRLESWRYGPGAFKVDWALDAPIPWEAEEVGQAGTVHLGGTLEEIAAAECRPARGAAPERPFVLLAQPTLFDSSRAPAGKHIAWAYCHVPNGWAGDATAAIEAQVERFAPGFRDRIVARRTHGPAQLEAWNANLVGGDVNGGALTVSQTLGPARWSLHPWSTPVPHLYVCSASRPPGGGVHGMVGYHAAREALRRTFRRP